LDDVPTGVGLGKLSSLGCGRETEAAVCHLIA